MKKSLLLLFTLLFAVMSAWAQTTRYVNPDGNCGGNTPCYTTIQAAINASVDGDIIQIATGTYTEALTVGKSLTFIGAGSSLTTITSSSSPIIQLSVTGKSFSFQDLTIYGNVTNLGIRASSAISINSFTLQNVIAENCKVAIYLSEGDASTVVNNLYFDNLTLRDNTHIGAYIGRSVASGTVTNSNIYHNGFTDADGAGWQKVGLQFVDFYGTVVPHVVVTNTIFLDNGAGLSSIEKTGLSFYTATNIYSAVDLLSVSGCTFTNHPQYAVRIRNGYNVGNTATVNGTFTNNWLDIWFSNVIGTTSSTTLVRNTQTGIRTVGPGPTYSYSTIQAAIDAASAGEVIQVAAGTYPENLVINKSLTLKGANADFACGSRGAESIIAPASGLPISATADGVTINGFEITAPGYQNAIVCGNTSNLNINYNYIHHIGTTVTGTNVHAINYTVANATSTSNVFITNNCIDYVSSSSLTNNSSAAIGVLQSTSTGDLTSLVIEYNTISNVHVNTGDWPTGKIAYGLIINVGGSNSSYLTNGKIANATIRYNEISYLSGFISTGIGLEGNTENANVSFNTISYLSGNKVDVRSGGGYDLNALKFENNRYVSTCTVTDNDFLTNTFTHGNPSGVGYAVSNYVPTGLAYTGGTTGPATLGCNWYGTGDYDLIKDNANMTGKIFNKDNCQTSFVPFETTITGPCDGGPVKVYNGTTLVSVHATISAAIDASTTLPGFRIEVAAGTYAEKVTVNKPLTLQGAGASSTIVDGDGLGESILLNIPNPTGDITIDGFTFKNATNYQITISGGTNENAVISFTNNIIIGRGTVNGTANYGLYGSGFGKSKIIFSNNEVSKCFLHGFFLERWLGETEVSYNNFTEVAGRAIGFMAYEQNSETVGICDVTNKQYVHHNTIDANNSSGGIVFIAPLGTGYNDIYAGGRYKGGKFTNVEIKNNTILNVQNIGTSGAAIQLEVDGDYGGIFDAIIEGNTVTAKNIHQGRGIRLLAGVKDALIQNNVFTDLAVGVYQSYSFGQPGAVGPTGNKVNYNSFNDCNYGVDNQYADNLNIIDATCNWWGTTDPYLIDLSISGSVDAVPFRTSSTGECDGEGPILLNGQQYLSLQDAIEDAANGDVIEVMEGGSYACANINISGKSVTVTNSSGATATIIGCSPALTVTSGTITYEGFTFTTATDDPTILITGGKLILRNCTIEESTGFSGKSCIEITGSGELDAGTTAYHGSNTFQTGDGVAILNNSTVTANASGNYWGTIVYTEIQAEITGSGTTSFLPYCNQTFTVCGDPNGPLTYAPKYIRPVSTTDEINIPITVTNFNDVNSVSLKLGYDVTRMEFVSGLMGPSVPSGTTLIDAVGGKVIISFFTFDGSENSPGFNLADNSVLVNLKFKYILTGEASLTWTEVDPSGTDLEYQHASTMTPYFDEPTGAYYIAGYVTEGSLAFTREYPGIPTGNTNEEIHAVVSGGTGSYTYWWTGPAGFTPIAGNPVVPGPYGNYTVVATDGSGATITGTYYYGPVHNIDTYIDYATIQEGIDATETTDLHTLTVDPGNYPENVTIYKQLTLYGAQAGVDARNRTSTGASVITNMPNMYSMRITANNVTIDGFLIDQPGSAHGDAFGIIVPHTDDLLNPIGPFANATIKNVHVKNAQYNAILLYNATTATVEQCWVENAGTGGISGGGAPLVSSGYVNINATIKNNLVQGALYGIGGWNNGSTIEANTIIGVSTANAAGIGGQFVNSTIKTNTVSGYVAGAGIALIDNVTLLPGSVPTEDALIQQNTISNCATGILIDNGKGNVVNINNISGGLAGINVMNVQTTTTKGLAITENTIANALQLYGTTPNMGIALTNISGDQALTITNNGISGPFYGYLVYNLNTSPVTTITGGTITSVMQGVAAINVDPQTGTVYAPSTFELDGLTMSGFTGDYSGLSGDPLDDWDFHAGVYVFTGGANLNPITLTVDNVSVTGTGKHAPNSAGMSFSDFSTYTGGTMQTVTVNTSTISNNLNRGINVRGNTNVTVNTSTLAGNGGDPHGTGGNNGIGVSARYTGTTVNMYNCFLTLPATVTSPYTVSGLFAFDGATINASDNSLLQNGNTGMFLANNQSSTINATCNWWGTNTVAGVAALINGVVTFDPWLVIGTDNSADPGFQPVPGSCTGATNLYVNDLVLTDDFYTTAIGDDSNIGTAAAPFLTITKAVNTAVEGTSIWVDAGTFQEQVFIDETVDITGVDRTKTIVKAPASLIGYTNANGTSFAIVYANNNSHTINIDKILVDGDNGRPNATFTGVHYFAANGTFSNSRITGIRNNPYSGGQGGTAFTANHQWDVSVDQTVSVIGNIIDDYQKGGIVINELNTQGIVTGNTVTGQNIPNINGQNGIQFGFGAYGSITGNIVINNIWNKVEHPHQWTASGILLVGVGVNYSNVPTGNLTVVGGNNLNNNEVGLFVAGDNTYGYASNAGLTVNGSTFTNNKIHTWLDDPETVPPVADSYDKRVDNPAQTNIVYGCIQYAIDEATPTGGDVLNASAHTFIENVVVHTPVTVNGAGIALTTVLPSFVGANTGGGSLAAGSSNIFLVQANNVIIQNLTVDGNNPSLTSGVLSNGVDVDARNGIITNHTLGTFNNLNVNHVNIQNIYLRGIYASSGGTFNIFDNTVTNVAGEGSSIAMMNWAGSGIFTLNEVSNSNDGIVSNHSSGTTYSFNTVSNCGSGIHSDNNGSSASTLGASSTPDIISNNTVTNGPDNAYGIFIFASYENSQVYENTVSGVTVGLCAAGQYGGTPLFTRNTVTGNDNGIYTTTSLFGLGSTNCSAIFTNNFIDNNTVEGIEVEAEGTYTNTTTVNENHITGNAIGVVTSGTGTFNLNFTCNWWGSADFAGVSTAVGASNPPVDYAPWLTNGTDSDLVTAGFQPVPGSCDGNPIITGTLKYNNSSKTPMNGVTLVLKSAVSPFAQVGAPSVTTSTGTYTFTDDDILNGNYTIEVSNNPKPSGSINSTDAAQTNTWATTPFSIEYVRFLAGDVWGDNNIDPNYAITSNDAWHIQRRFVYGPTYAFNRGPWVYWHAGDPVSVSTNKGDAIAVTVSNANLTRNLLGQVTGDFNASYVWTGTKNMMANVMLSYGDTRQLNAAAETELPVYLLNAAELSAISIAFTYPADKMEVLEVKMKENSGLLDWFADGEELRIGWNATTPLSFAAGEEIFTIRLRTGEGFVQGDEIRLAVTADPINELADASLNVIPNAELYIEVLGSNTLGTGELALPEALSLKAFPNPFSHFTNIQYALPHDGRVTIEISNLLGMRALTLVDEVQTGGNYTLKMDALPLQAGIYVATLRLTSANGDLVQTIKLIRQR